MQYPEVEFIASNQKSESHYICYLAKAIEQDYFHSKGFIVLPYPIPRDTLSVYFPKLNYSPTFWKQIKKCKNENLGESFTEVCVNEIITSLKSLTDTSKMRTQQVTVDNWRKVEKSFFRLVDEFLKFNQILRRLGKIQFLLTKFGTRGSFNFTKKNAKLNIMATFRHDFHFSEIGRTILLALYHADKRVLGSPYWNYRQVIMDYLTKETIFKDLLTNGPTKQTLLDSQKAHKYVKKSKRYLTELGFPPQSIIKLDTEENIRIKGKTDAVLFTVQEKKMLRELVNNRGKLVSYDNLAETIWGEESLDRFSLYAISKSIENIRRKFRQLGIHKKLILTARKKGYILND